MQTQPNDNPAQNQASTDPFNFAKFVPGFDFLKNLSQQAGSGGAQSASLPHTPPGMPDFTQWIAPTLKPEELDKRIQELKTVQFWLDQNAKMLAATIQALEVQKMTLSALNSMNFSFAPAAPTPAPTAASAKTTTTIATPDPMLLWQAMSQQFQNIANTALHDAGQQMKQHIPTQAQQTQPTKEANTPVAKSATSPRPAAAKKTPTRKARAPTKVVNV
jgi:hypothetical protein